MIAVAGQSSVAARLVVDDAGGELGELSAPCLDVADEHAASASTAAKRMLHSRTPEV